MSEVRPPVRFAIGRAGRRKAVSEAVGTAAPDDRGWRLPAKRTELAVMAGIRRILSDRRALASTLKACGFAAGELKQAIEAVDAKVKSHQQMETAEDMSALIERVELKRDSIQITLDFHALLPADRFPAGGGKSAIFQDCSLSLVPRAARIGPPTRESAVFSKL